MSSRFGCCRLAWALASLLALGACATTPGIRVDDVPHATSRSSWPRAGIDDQRQAFAPVFCRFHDQALADAPPPCSKWLWRLPSTSTPSAPMPASGALPRTRTLVIVPGIFGECVAPWVTPFSKDYAALEAMGYRVKVLPLKGRASSTLNAQIIHEQLSDPALGLSDAVVVAYSKGVTDFMLAASRPEAAAWRGKVSAFVSVAGTANGTPAASHGASLYAALLARRAFKTCPPSDGGGVRSLNYTEAMATSDAFLASHPPFRTYSVVAVAAHGPINPILGGFYRLLSRIDERNDGQVLMEDAVVPGSIVLGVFRADHWSIALPFEESTAPQMKPLSKNNSFPRGALIRALLAFTAPVAGPNTTSKEQ